MMTERKLKVITGLLSVTLLTTLLLKLTKVPGRMILSGLFLGGIIIIGIILGCLVLAVVLRLIFKKTSFLTLLFITTSISFLAFHYKLYSPVLTIKVPNGYTGEITLVLSNVDANILTVDSNGIGYLNKWTYNKTYSKPVVVQLDGKNLDRNLLGFNPSTFFGKGKFCCIDGQEIEFLSFEITPDDQIGQSQHHSRNLTTIIDKRLLLFSKPESTIIQTTNPPRKSQNH